MKWSQEYEISVTNDSRSQINTTCCWIVGLNIFFTNYKIIDLLQRFQLQQQHI